MSDNGLRDVLCEMKRITASDVSIWNTSGEVLLSTYDIEQEFYDKVKGEIEGKSKKQQGVEKVTIYPICVQEEIINYISFKNEELPQMVNQLCVSQLESFYRLRTEELDKGSYIKKLIRESMTDLEIETAASKMHIEHKVKRILYMLCCEEKSVQEVKALVGQIYRIGTNDFLEEIEAGKIIFVRELDDHWCHESLSTDAYTLSDTIEGELLTRVRVGYGEINCELKYIKDAYKQANTAIEVGNTFYQDRKVIKYNELGVGRLVHGLPKELSENFLNEVLNGNAIEQFDEEIMGAVHKFFYNNLNISETARQLYVHRNTLVYRLGKVEKKTGLDIRLFEDALTFKLALMVSEQVKQ